MNKQQLRRSIREQKRAMTQMQIREKSEQLARLFLETEEYRRAQSIYGYLSCNQEVRTLLILQQATKNPLYRTPSPRLSAMISMYELARPPSTILLLATTITKGAPLKKKSSSISSLFR